MFTDDKMSVGELEVSIFVYMVCCVGTLYEAMCEQQVEGAGGGGMFAQVEAWRAGRGLVTEIIYTSYRDSSL